MTTDDLIRSWFRPLRPFIRVAMLFAPGAQPLIEDMIDGRTSVPRGLWILFWFGVGAIDSLYQRSPRARSPAWTIPPITGLPPALPPAEGPPSGDLPRPEDR